MSSEIDLTSAITTLCFRAMVNFSLSQEQRVLRSAVKDFAHDVLSTAPKLYNHFPTQTTRFRSTLPIYRSAVSAGLIKGQVPIPLGGTSASIVDAAIVVEELYAVDPSTALTILGTGLGMTPLILAANPEQRERLLKPFTRQEGERLAAFVHSEPGGTANWLRKGSPGLQTTAYQDGDEWVVNGEKLWTTNSGGWDSRGADVQCVVCRQGRPNEPQNPAVNPSSNILMLAITREDIANNAPGAYEVLSDPELGGHKSTSGPHTRFTHLRVPAANLLAKPGEGAQLVEKTFGMSAAIVGAMCVGIMRDAFEVALSFCKTNSCGGTEPIIGKQSVADRLIDIKMKIEAARALTWKAMCVLESKEEALGWEQRLEITLQAKVWCSDMAPKAVIECMSVVGM
ncbi:putative electron transport oxidoreductase [Boeremia exigua]|uniref:putative electron transport oxidoreductase n=1 Tax=Boeremia exigua TaxID=749465 RepID=UPI001E8ECEC5|nr:putative electron transport oxidoreductase [Boeremia exigua]KAH6613821.1 putative electron transport oxidoreductase [Boeremia exigua]